MKYRSPSRAAIYLMVGMLLLAATTIFAQKKATNRSSEEKIAKRVCEMVKLFHINKKKIDDTVSKKLLNKYIKWLDPQKVFFTQADINQLRREELNLDDQVQEGDIEFAYKTFELCRKRVHERGELAHQLIDEDHDFNVDEEMVIDADITPWARDDAEMRERWRKRIKYEIVSLKIDDNTTEEVRERLHRRYRGVLRSMDQTEDHEILENYLGALTHAFDPHSSYMSPQTVEDFEIQMRLRLQGIGAALREKDGYTVVESIVEGGAADKDGRLKKGDKIIGVDKGDGTMVDVIEMKLSKVVRFIRGKKDTVVRLKVKTADETLDDETIKKGTEHIYDLTRQVIQLNQSAVRGEIINTGDRLDGTQARIGVIKVPSFYRDFEGARNGAENFRSATRDVLKALQDFQGQGGIDGLVIDLRWNGGGALTEAIDLSGLFIDEGPVVQVKDKDSKVKPYNDLDSGAAYTGPLVVICNRLSASASEIFAGAIKDYGRGIVVGDKQTHGKGTVQNVMPVPGSQLFQFQKSENLGMLKLTISQFYRVNGDSTQNRGVLSHIRLPSMLDNMEFGETYLENALAFDSVEPEKYSSVKMVSRDVVKSLKESSRRRVVSSKKFQETNNDIKKYLEKKQRKTVSLLEEKLRKERKEEKEIEKKREEEAKAQVGKNGKKKDDSEKEDEIFPESHYNNEVLHICLDYIDQLKKTVNTAGK